MITIHFYPKFLEEGIDKDAELAKYRAWLELHGDYGRLFMWDINRVIGAEHGEITGVRIFEDEIGTLFRLMHDV
jgi:hypothetical protein